MVKTYAGRMSAWKGPALFSIGFRPFFLFGACWAALAMSLWLATMTGVVALPTHLDPVSWHAHAFLFGYLSAIIAGFLLTAVPNWTGRRPVVGWELGTLVALWAAGRGAVLSSAHLSPALVATVDLAFPLSLGGVVLREVIAGRNWRNLPVLGLLAIFTLANALFHFEAARGAHAAEGLGIRLGLGAAIMMIALIGGRIVPSFTLNWLVKHGPGRLPVPPMQGFDVLALVALLAALLTWVTAPAHPVTGALLAFAGALHLVRLVRWAGDRTVKEPLLIALHGGYAFVPVGALMLATEVTSPSRLGVAAAQHLWMAGAIGLMTLAVMTRATRGHTGQELTADHGTALLYIAIVASVLARVAAGAWPEQATWLHTVSGVAWIAAFGGFVVLYGPLLLRPKPAC